MLMSIWQNQYNLKIPEYKKSSTNIKLDLWKFEEAHIRSDFMLSRLTDL